MVHGAFAVPLFHMQKKKQTSLLVQEDQAPVTTQELCACTGSRARHSQEHQQCQPAVMWVHKAGD